MIEMLNITAYTHTNIHIFFCVSILFENFITLLYAYKHLSVAATKLSGVLFRYLWVHMDIWTLGRLALFHKFIFFLQTFPEVSVFALKKESNVKICIFLYCICTYIKSLLSPTQINLQLWKSDILIHNCPFHKKGLYDFFIKISLQKLYAVKIIPKVYCSRPCRMSNTEV